MHKNTLVTIIVDHMCCNTSGKAFIPSRYRIMLGTLVSYSIPSQSVLIEALEQEFHLVNNLTYRVPVLFTFHISFEYVQHSELNNGHRDLLFIGTVKNNLHYKFSRLTDQLRRLATIPATKNKYLLKPKENIVYDFSSWSTNTELEKIKDNKKCMTLNQNNFQEILPWKFD